MPILGYLLYVGGALIALLFVADAYVPKQAPREDATHIYNIPIAAKQALGAPIIFSGATHNFGPAPPMTVVDNAGGAAKPVTEQALAQPAQPQQTVAARHEPKAARRRVARRKVSPEDSYAQVPDEWRRRYTYTGMAFARPFGW